MTVPLLLDTDIGTDVDDELALALLLGSPEVDLLGVTVSYGDVGLRARLAGRFAALAGVELTVVPGASTPLSGRAVWWAGHEGLGYPDLADVPVRGDVSGADFLAGVGGGRQVQLLCIAPMTTLATAVRDHPGVAARVSGVTAMGGHFGAPAGAGPEHNVVSDLDAARIVAGASWPLTMVGLEITRRVRLLEPDLAGLAAAGPLGAILAAAARAWMWRWNEDFEVPHDPVAALALLRPDLFAFSGPGFVHIDDAGTTTFRPDPAGRARIVLDLDEAAVRAEIMARVLGGLGGPVRGGG